MAQLPGGAVPGTKACRPAVRVIKADAAVVVGLAIQPRRGVEDWLCPLLRHDRRRVRETLRRGILLLALPGCPVLELLLRQVAREVAGVLLPALHLGGGSVFPLR